MEFIDRYSTDQPILEGHTQEFSNLYYKLVACMLRYFEKEENWFNQHVESNTPAKELINKNDFRFILMNVGMFFKVPPKGPWYHKIKENFGHYDIEEGHLSIHKWFERLTEQLI